MLIQSGYKLLKDVFKLGKIRYILFKRNMYEQSAGEDPQALGINMIAIGNAAILRYVTGIAAGQDKIPHSFAIKRGSQRFPR